MLLIVTHQNITLVVGRADCSTVDVTGGTPASKWGRQLTVFKQVYDRANMHPLSNSSGMLYSLNLPCEFVHPIKFRSVVSCAESCLTDKVASASLRMCFTHVSESR